LKKSEAKSRGGGGFGLNDGPSTTYADQVDEMITIEEERMR
jgi:hypothetical protein